MNLTTDELLQVHDYGTAEDHEEETTCGQPHNNGDDDSQCGLCQMIIRNL